MIEVLWFLVLFPVLIIFMSGYYFAIVMAKMCHFISTTSDIPSYSILESVKARDRRWESVRQNHIKKNSICRVCGKRKSSDLEVHHIRPYHLYPELELDPSNLITLCRIHHFWFGHLGDWSAYNPAVVNDCLLANGKIKNRYYGRMLP